MKHYLGVNIPNSASSCITYPIWLAYFYNDLTYTPLILYYPYKIRLLDMSLPAKKLRNVVLPEPEGPRIAVKDYAGITPLWECKMILLGCFFITAYIFILYDSSMGFRYAKMDEFLWCYYYRSGVYSCASVCMWSEIYNLKI